jgi:hypothetical protein
VDPGAGLDDMGKFKFSDPTVVQPVDSRYTDYATVAYTVKICLYRVAQRNGKI